jgi:hypothetical protein
MEYLRTCVLICHSGKERKWEEFNQPTKTNGKSDLHLLTYFLVTRGELGSLATAREPYPHELFCMKNGLMRYKDQKHDFSVIVIKSIPKDFSQVSSLKRKLAMALSKKCLTLSRQDFVTKKKERDIVFKKMRFQIPFRVFCLL